MEDKKLSFSLRLINWLCQEELVEEIEGNLLEYRYILEKGQFSKLRYWIQVLSYLRPAFLKNFQFHLGMFHFNPKIAVRSLMRHKTTTAINLLGFVTGLSSVLFLYFYIQKEYSYDNFHADADQIYRVFRTSKDADQGVYDISALSAPYGPALVTDFEGQITEQVRLSMQSQLVTFAEREFIEKRIAFADQNFFTFFSFPLLAGDPGTVLENVNNIVISETIALKYFGNENPLGKILTLDHQDEFVVSGIISETGLPTHLEFEMVASIEFFKRFNIMDRWFPNFATTYIKIPDPNHLTYINNSLSAFMEKHLSPHVKSGHDINGLKLLPLSEVYFHKPRYEMDYIRSGNKTNLTILIWVSLGILLIAAFNYINLALAQSLQRAKEVAVRKVIGSGRRRLIIQFLGETFLLLSVSFTIAVCICLLFRPLLNNLFDLQVSFDLVNPRVLIALGSLFTVLLLGAGMYPAILLSSVSSARGLKARKSTFGSLHFRKILIVAQFSLAIFLICVTSLSTVQVNYMKNIDPGFSSEGILIVDVNNSAIRRNYEAFKNSLLAKESIKSITTASGQPGGFHDSYLLEFKPGNPLRVNTVFADDHYLEAFDLDVIAGRGFDRSFGTDSASMLINEKVLSKLNMTAEEVIGKTLRFQYREYERKVIGVIKNYNFKEVKDEIEPLAIVRDPEMRKIMIRIMSKDMSSTLGDIEGAFAEFSSNYPMEASFLEDQLERQYKPVEQQTALFSIFSGIAILLACLGIFGLVAFSAARKQKEMSIRKVLGASYKQVLIKVSGEYLVLVITGAVVAIPLAYIYLQDWLSSYALKINLWAYLPLFMLSGAVVVLVSLGAVFAKAHESATKNPAEMIRNE